MKKIAPIRLMAFTGLFLLLFTACKKNNPSGLSPKLTITGTVDDCSYNPVDSGYVNLLVDGISDSVQLINGAFTVTVDRDKEKAKTQIVLTPINLQGNDQGPADTLMVDTDSVNVGKLHACVYDEWVTFSTGGGTFRDFNLPDFSTVSYSSGTDGDAIFGTSKLGSFGPNITIYLAHVTGLGVYPVRLAQVTVSSSEAWKGEGLTCTITTFPAVGGYIRGNYTGTAKRWNAYYNTNPPYPASGAFVIKRAQ